jgi:hypothetical protein
VSHWCLALYIFSMYASMHTHVSKRKSKYMLIALNCLQQVLFVLPFPHYCLSNHRFDYLWLFVFFFFCFVLILCPRGSNTELCMCLVKYCITELSPICDFFLRPGITV